MSRSTEFLQRKIKMAGELKTVVRNLKTIAITRIGPFEGAVKSLSEYYRTVELGLMACTADVSQPAGMRNLEVEEKPAAGLVVFGSDQGMVGRFNDHAAEAALTLARSMQGEVTVWPVGDLLYARLLERADDTVTVEPCEHIPDTIEGVTPLISRILRQIIQHQEASPGGCIELVYNRPIPQSGYESVCVRLLPIDDVWMEALKVKPWPTRLKPQVRRQKETTFAALIREYLFVSAFRACAESMTSENAARLAAMQGAEENIDRMLETLQTEYHQTRQSAIDSELFEVVSGFETVKNN